MLLNFTSGSNIREYYTLAILISGFFSGFEHEELIKKLEIKSSANARLSSLNMQLSKEINNFQTGGDSYCYLFPLGQEMFALFHEGKYPLQNVTAFATHLGDYRLYQTNNFSLPSGKIEFETVYGNKYINYEIPYFHNSIVGWDIVFNSGKKQWVQNIRFVKINNVYEFAYRILKYNEQKHKYEILKEESRPNFPKTKEGIQWYKNDRLDLLPVYIQFYGDPTDMKKYIEKIKEK